MLDVGESYREFARIVLLIALIAAVAATAAAWLIERGARQDSAAGTPAKVVDGWFLAFVGMAVALVALLALGLTTTTLALVGIALLIWLAAVFIWRRSLGSLSPA